MSLEKENISSIGKSGGVVPSRTSLLCGYKEYSKRLREEMGNSFIQTADECNSLSRRSFKDCITEYNNSNSKLKRDAGFCKCVEMPSHEKVKFLVKKYLRSDKINIDN